MRFFLVGFIIVMLLFLSCKELVKYSNIPEIQNSGFKVEEKYEEGSKTPSYDVTIKFSLIDGDGDIGHKDGEGEVSDINSNEVIKPPSIFMERYRKIGGEYIKDTLSKNILNKSLLYLEPQGQNKTLIADIEIAMELLPTVVLNTDTIRYEYYLVDRAENKSNVLFSADIPFKIPTDGYVNE